MKLSLPSFIRPGPAETEKALAANDVTLAYYIEGNTSVPITAKMTGQFGEDINAQVRARKELHADADGLALAYAYNPIAHRCVDLRASKVSDMPFRMIDKATKEPVETHPFIDAMRLSEQIYKKDLLASWEYSRAIHGMNYMEKVLDQYGRPLTFRWLNPRMIDIQDQYGYITEFLYFSNVYSGSTIHFKPWEISYDFLFNPMDDWRGLAPMQVALQAININNAIQSNTKSFFQNGARPGGILAAKQGTHIALPDQKRLLSWWEKQLEGPSKRFKTIFMPAALEYQAVQQPPSPDHVELETDSAIIICNAFGVPHQLINASDSRYSAGSQHVKEFYENTIIPECEAIQDAINNDCLPFLDDTGDFLFQFDFDQIRAMMDDQVNRATALNARLLSGNTTLNETRRGFGLPDIKDGDVFFVPKANLPVKEKDMGKIDQLVADAQTPANQGAPQENSQPRKDNGNKIVANANNASAKKSYAEDELRMWEKKTLNRGVEKARSFKAYHLPDTVEEFLRADLYGIAPDSSRSVIKGIFDEARSSLKAVFDQEEFAELAERLAEAGLEDLVDGTSGQP